MEQEECRTITEELCEEAQYLTVLDSYGNEVGSGTSGQNIDSYGAPLAPPLKEEGEPRPPALYSALLLTKSRLTLPFTSLPSTLKNVLKRVMKQQVIAVVASSLLTIPLVISAKSLNAISYYSTGFCLSEQTRSGSVLSLLLTITITLQQTTVYRQQYTVNSIIQFY